MSSIVISGDTSGTVTIAAPAIAGTNTMTLAAGSGTLAPKVLSTAVASTSGTSIDFTNIPSWVTRITVMFNGVSTSGTSNIKVQIGAGSIAVSTYNSTVTAGAGATNDTTSFLATSSITAANSQSGIMVLCNVSGNTWVSQSSLSFNNASVGNFGSGTATISGTLDRVRITTVNGTDTFDAGTINIMYE